MRIRLLLLSSFILCFMPLMARSEITLAAVFRDHAILQRDKPLPIWGQASAGEKITVSFHGQSVGTTADGEGQWIVFLDAIPASMEAAELVVAGKDTVVVKDVLIGDVWLASGQSNMEWSVSLLNNEERQIAQVDLPFLRQLRIERTVADRPARTVPTSGWEAASPQTVGGFTAVGYFFGRELQRKLNIPIGIILSAWGGTEIESWMSDTSRLATTVGPSTEQRWKQAMSEWPPERVAAYPALNAAWQKAEDEAKASRKKNLVPWPNPPATLDSPARPGGLFNGMIAPLQPVSLRGVIWYQGESNAGRPTEYVELFPAMIRAWRENWGDQQLPFYFVQLPDYSDGNPAARTWARFREAQTSALALPATGMAVAIDIGDRGDIHPTAKMELGRRLALIAKARLHGTQGDDSGPVFANAVREGSAMRVVFTHAGSGLISHQRPVQSLEIAGADRIFYVGFARIDRDTLIVSSPHVKEPVAIRYAWSNAPDANLYGGAGLPAAPFRSDNW